MAEVATAPEVDNRPPVAGSPPPNCAICLEPCTNKCFSNSCMHEFCFKCLLEWSKVKPVCPLCKQSFNSIIHNVKSNEEYDQHVVENPGYETLQSLFEENEMDDLFSPQPSRHFQFRTTFTVDPRGELAIQQMLLTHPLTNSVYIPGFHPLHRYGRFNPRRRDVSSTAFRRSIYSRNLWAHVPAVGMMIRTRDTSPNYFRENPASRNRLVPWLNRELNALLEENTQQVMQLVDVILTHLSQHHIKGHFFRNMLNEYLATKTDHFIHEFYTFMRSPYDMIAYDRNVNYTPREPIIPHVEVISDRDSDSDVAIVSVSMPAENSLSRPTLEVIEINSSDGESVILVDEENQEQPAPSQNIEQVPTVVDKNSSDEENRKPVLPLKIRLKHKRQSREKKSSRTKRKHRHSSSSSSSSPSSSDSDDSYSKTKRSKRKHKKCKHKDRKSYSKRSKTHSRKVVGSDRSSSEDDEPLIYRQRKSRHSESDDHIPLAKLKHKEKKKKTAKKERREKPSSLLYSNNMELPGPSNLSDTHNSAPLLTSSMFPYSNSHDLQPSYYGTPPRYPLLSYPEVPLACQYPNETDILNEALKVPLPHEKLCIKNETCDYDNYYPGPSSGRLRSIIIKKENSKDLWYSRPCPSNNTDSSDED